MPSQPRNMPEQEHSIKARSHELFVEPVLPGAGTKPTKAFLVYLRETPAHPHSPFTKAVFWMLGMIVAGLFLAAVWRLSYRPKSKVPTSGRPAKTAMVHDRGDAASRRSLAGLA